MKSRAIIPLLIGLVIGVFAIRQFMNVLQRARGETSEVKTTKLVYAAVDIDPTIEIAETMVELKECPEALKPEFAMSDLKEVVGRVSARSIPAGMPIATNYLSPKGTPPGMAVRIQEGYRAVSVPIDESSGVAGWIKPGCHVDVALLITVREGPKSETISKVILQNIEVLAVGQDLGTVNDPNAALAKSVTLLVKPEDVPRLHLAATKGKIRLAMRNQLDLESGQAAMTTDNDLLGTQGVAPGLASAAAGNLVERLLTGKTNPDSNQTDKDNHGQSSTSEVTTLAAAPEPWAVEVMKGTHEPEVVWFKNADRGASRLASPPTVAARHPGVTLSSLAPSGKAPAQPDNKPTPLEPMESTE